MSRPTELARRIEQKDPALGKELASEIKSFAGRRSIGLNFERHIPETCELPDRTVRRGDKVRFRAPRRTPRPSGFPVAGRLARQRGQGARLPATDRVGRGRLADRGRNSESELVPRGVCSDASRQRGRIRVVG